MKLVLRCLVFAVAVGCALGFNVTIGLVNFGQSSADFRQALSIIQESETFPVPTQFSVVEIGIDVKAASLPVLSTEVANFRDEEVCATVVLDCWDEDCPDSSFILRALPQPIIRVGFPASKDHDITSSSNVLEIHPSANQLAMMLHHTIESFSWRSLTVFYDKVGGCIEVFEELMSLLSRSDIYYRMSEIPMDENIRSAQLESFLRGSKSRKEKRFLIIASAFTTNEFLEHALLHLMLDPRHHWILATLEHKALELHQYRNTGVHLTTFRLQPHEEPEISSEHIKRKFSLQANLAYDAAMAVSHAARMSIEEEVGCDGIKDAVGKVSFSGRSGTVTFGSLGTRKNISIEIMELSSDGVPAHVGEWKDGRGVTLEEWTRLSHKQTTDPILGGADLKVLGRLKNPWLTLAEGAECKIGKVCPRSYFQGFLPDLMDALQKRLGFNWKMNLTKESIGEKVNGKWGGLTGILVRGEADTVLYGATTRSRRTEALEYSFPLVHQGYYIIIKRADSTLNIMDVAGLFEFLAPFDKWVWASIGAAVVAVSLALYVVNWLDPFEWRSLAERGIVEKEEGNNFNLVQSAWFTYGCLVGAGGENLPKSIAGRVVAGTWWFFVLVTVASYTANLAAFLGKANKVYAIHTPDQLVAQRTMPYGTYEGYTLLKFMQNTTLPPFRAMGKYMKENKDTAILKSKDEGLRRASKGNYAFIASANNKYLLQNDWCNLTLASEPFFKSMIALPFPAGSPFAEPFNRALMAMQDEGIIDNLKNKWLEKPGKCMKHVKSDGVLRINNFKGVFIVLLLGITAGAIVGLFECFGHKGRTFTKKICAGKKSEDPEIEMPDASNTDAKVGIGNGA